MRTDAEYAACDSPVLQAVMDAIAGTLDPHTQIADHPNVKFAQMQRLKLTQQPGTIGAASAPLDDALLLQLWRSVQGPNAGLTGPLIRFAGLVRAQPVACTNPPDGWTCSRKVGHDGPCAASPQAETLAPSAPPVRAAREMEMLEAMQEVCDAAITVCDGCAICGADLDGTPPHYEGCAIAALQAVMARAALPSVDGPRQETKS